MPWTLRLFDGRLGRELCHDLPERVVPVDSQERSALRHDLRLGVGFSDSGPYVFHVLRHANKAVRIMARQVGVRQVVAHRPAVGFSRACRDENPSRNIRYLLAAQ